MRLAIALIVALLATAGSEAQTDPSKVLIGQWQGEIRDPFMKGNPNRILVVQSVNQSDGKWTAEGLYGIAKASGKVHIEVDMTGQWPSIRFVTGANSVVKLNLVDNRSLTGTITYSGSSQYGGDRPMNLRKTD
jgi:hypothetical protein